MMNSISFVNSSSTTTADIIYLNHQFSRHKCFSRLPRDATPRDRRKISLARAINGSPTCSHVEIDQTLVSSSQATTRACSNEQKKLKIAVVGFGNFGQFLAREMVKQGHQVLAYSRSDYSKVAKEIGVQFFRDPDDLCEEHPQVVLLCTSILSTEKVLRSLPVDRLRRSTLIVDVLSVKEFPRTLFLRHLPEDLDILCTHPMFGPDSGKSGWDGLPFVFDKVRVGSDPTRTHRVNTFLDIFKHAGCRMVEMTCMDHDKHAAGSQFITHMMGRVLEKVGLSNTPINTKGYESLLNLVDNTARDSFELFYGLFLYNKNAMEELDRLDWAFDTVKMQLSGYLHDFASKKLMLETGNELAGIVSGKIGDDNHNNKRLMLSPPTNSYKNVTFTDTKVSEKMM
uniref:Arogenate dehydrogenase alpha n=1 Tax=Spergularia marina TaxID=191669 RepID=A0A223FZ02_9CARY|nr:arogenate dehydrogenase alpha [Spergularia marina]